MQRFSLALLACAVLTGCVAAPEWGWKRTDGRSAKNDPVLLRRFEADKTGCVGETQQAGIVGAAGGRGTPTGTLRSMRDHEAMNLIQDCMARKGYVVVPRMETAAAR